MKIFDYFKIMQQIKAKILISAQLKTISSRGTKCEYRCAPDSREQITVLTCASAKGDLSDPFVLFPGTQPSIEFGDVDPKFYNIGVSENGWIRRENFYDWVVNLWYPSIKDKIPFPVLLFVDGYTSHVSLALSEWCKEHNVIIYCFLPHAR